MIGHFNFTMNRVSTRACKCFNTSKVRGSYGDGIFGLPSHAYLSTFSTSFFLANERIEFNKLCFKHDALSLGI